MPIPPDVKSAADEILQNYAAGKIPPEFRDRLRLEVTWRGATATLSERRPYFRDPERWTEHPVARFKYKDTEQLWLLYCRDQKQKWYLFEPMPSSPRLNRLIYEVECDKTGIFWG